MSKLMRPPEEIAAWKRRDPISVLGKKLADLGYLDGDAVDEIESAIKKELEESIVLAEATPAPRPADALTHVYAESVEAMGL